VFAVPATLPNVVTTPLGMLFTAVIVKVKSFAGVVPNKSVPEILNV
jgi:hypothetical protein